MRKCILLYHLKTALLDDLKEIFKMQPLQSCCSNAPWNVKVVRASEIKRFI